MGVELFLGGILEPNIDIYASIFPWNHFKLFFQTNTMQTCLKNTHLFFLLFRRSILNLIYLFYFRYSRFEFISCIIPIIPLSNAMGQTLFGFFKAKLCPISHNDLIMDWFSRTNFYDMPRVTISSFGSEIDPQETTVRVI